MGLSSVVDGSSHLGANATKRPANLQRRPECQTLSRRDVVAGYTVHVPDLLEAESCMGLTLEPAETQLDRPRQLLPRYSSVDIRIFF